MRYIILLLCAAGVLAGCAQTSKWTPQPKSAQAAQEAVDLVALKSRYTEAKSAYKSGEIEQAKQVLEGISRDYPKLTPPLVNLGLIAQNRNNLDKAKRLYGKVLEIEPENAPTLNQLGMIAREEGRFTNALRYYQRALAANPNEALYHYNIAILFDLYISDKKQALKHYQSYQEMSDTQDEQVTMWITDLKRQLK